MQSQPHAHPIISIGQTWNTVYLMQPDCVLHKYANAIDVMSAGRAYCDGFGHVQCAILTVAGATPDSMLLANSIRMHHGFPSSRIAYVPFYCILLWPYCSFCTAATVSGHNVALAHVQRT